MKILNLINISHSGRIAVCAAARDAEIGVDVEQIREVNISEFSHYFSPEIFADILRSGDPLRVFFSMWTKAESVMKADGRGMLIKSTDIRLSEDQETVKDDCKCWFVSELDLLEGHIAHICTDQKNISVVRQQVDLHHSISSKI